MSFILPDKALVQHIAITGKAGSGKTNSAKVMVERFLSEKRRVCIIDPTGAWWGLKSNATGKKAAYEVTIFGGAHADFPLSDKHGNVLGELVATTDMPCIIDTSEMGVNERTRFMADFAEMLYKKNVSNPLHLVVDECHEFAPQMTRTPQAGIMLNAFERMVTGGRVRGFRVLMITQRPAALNKSVLTQVETLIAFRMTGAPDRHAVEDWIAANADKVTGKEILQSMASLPTGEGWVWSPEMGILERRRFPKSATYDSGQAPTGEQVNVVLAKIDHAEIEHRMGAVVKEGVENDPKRLRARVAELEKAANGTTAPKPDPEALQKVRADGYAAGRADGLREALQPVHSAIALARTSLDQLMREIGDTGQPRAHAAQAIKLPRQVVKSAPERVKLPPSEGVTAPQQRILDAMAKLESLGVGHMKKGQVGAFAGASPKSSAFQNNVSRLRTLGLLDYPRPGEVSLTAAGTAAAAYPDAPPTLNDLHRAWLNLLSGPQARIVECIIGSYPESMSKAELAEKAGASALSSAFQNNVSALRSLGLLDYPGKGYVIATDILFPSGVR
jgi:hypothetical protein